MKTDKTYIIIGGFIAVFGLGFFLILKKRSKAKITSSFDVSAAGNGSSSIPKGDYITEPNWGQPFDMNYKKEVETFLNKKVKGLDSFTARRYAKKLKEAKNPFNDDEAVVAEIFGKYLKDKAQVSDLSRAFWNVYKLDLWKYLTTFLSSNELTKYIRKPIRNLPNYRI